MAGPKTSVSAMKRTRVPFWKGSVLRDGAFVHHVVKRDAALEFLRVDLAVAADLDAHRLREGIDDRRPHAVEAAGDLVGSAAELPACVEGGHDGFEGGPAGGCVQVCGDAATVVADGDGVVFVERDEDMIAIVGHGLVDGVVHDLVHEMVEATLVGAADVHAGPPANGLQPFEDLDVACGVPGFLLFDHDAFKAPGAVGSCLRDTQAWIHS